MRDEFRLLIVVGKAALITIIGVFAGIAFVLALGFLASKMMVPRRREEVLQLLGAASFLSIGIAVWIGKSWMFRTLQAHFTRGEARAMATAFAGLSPVWLTVTMLLGEFPAGYAVEFLGSHLGRIGAFAGLVAGIGVTSTLVSFIFCLLTFRMTRQIIKVETMYFLETTN